MHMNYYEDRDFKSIMIIAIVSIIIIIMLWSWIVYAFYTAKSILPTEFKGSTEKFWDGSNEIRYVNTLDADSKPFFDENHLGNLFAEPFNPNELVQTNDTTYSRKKQLSPKISGKESSMAYTVKSDIGSEREDNEISNDKNMNIINHKKYTQDIFNSQLRAGKLYNS